MVYYVFKIVLTALVVVLVSEVAKRHSPLGALLAALPLTSLLAFVWLHLEGAPLVQLGALSRQIFWLVLPSLVLFSLFPVLLERAFGFWSALGLSMAATAATYLLLFALLARFGVRVA